jgi:opacity protein-like surface antigen
MSKKVIPIIALTLVFFSSANAGLTGIGFGIHGGIISSYNNLTLEQSIQAVYGDFSIEKNMPDLGFHVVISTLRIVTFDGSFDYGWKKLAVFNGLDLTYSTLSATASVRAQMTLSMIKPYVGAGTGFYRNAYSLSGEQLNGGVIVLPADETKVGYLVKGGIELNIPMSPLTPFAEFRYNHVPTSGKATHFYQALAGLTLNLP